MDQLERAAVSRASAALTTITNADENPLLRFAQLQQCRVVARRLKQTVGRSVDDPTVVAAERLFGARRRDRALIEHVKGAVASAGTASGSWGAETFGPQIISTEFGVATLRLSVPALLNSVPVPFNVPLGSAATDPVFGWVAEKGAIPATSMTAASVTLKKTKIAGVLVISNVLAEDSDAAVLIERDATRSMVGAIDKNFLDPSVTASADLPGAVTSVLTPLVGGSISTAAGLDALLKTAQAQLTTAGSDLDAAAYVMHPTTATLIAALRATGGAPAFPNIGARGGELLGLPVIVSRGSPTGQIALLDGAEIFLADDPSVEATLSRETSVMQDTTGAATLMSMYGTESTAIRLVRRIGWSWRRRYGALVTLTIS